VIVDKAVYRDGVRQPCGDLSDALEELRADGQTRDFLWIGLKDPTDAEFALVNDELKLHPLAVEDAVKGNQRPKVELYDNTIFVVLKTLRYLEATSDVETGEVMVFLGERFVVTVRRGEANPLTAVRHRLEEHPALLRHGEISVLHAVMDSIVDTYVGIDVELQNDLDEIETAVFSGSRHVDSQVIYKLKREVLEFKRAVTPLIPPIERLAAKQTGLPVDPRTEEYFRDVYDHLVRDADRVQGFDDILNGVLQANLAQVALRDNRDVRRISAWVAILAVPTMVFGLYGMNFATMPELQWRYGYPAVLAVVAVACVLLYRAFKRAGWL
jgi:magnesium transporter